MKSVVLPEWKVFQRRSSAKLEAVRELQPETTRRFLMLRNSRGQLAIFVALIFQVLFIFFAMAINIALVVHDKINLQNATDLAAYYAAQRQAEILNVIAHENYMIRQSWKLATFRYRVWGAMGVERDPKHPIYFENAPPEAPIYQELLNPSACVTHSMWGGTDPDQNLCNRPLTSIPPLPSIQPIAPFNPFNIFFYRFAQQMQRAAAQNCSTHGAYNWWFAMVTLQAFREDQRNRKQVIFALARNLGRRDFVDLDGAPVEAGARATFEKNLTFSNAQNVLSFRTTQSFAGLEPQAWLKEIRVAPNALYADPRNDVQPSACEVVPQFVNEEPRRPAAQNILRADAPNGLGATDLLQWLPFIVTPIDTDYQFSVGVEKNPWFVPYVAVQAETAPRQVFFPFGSAVRIVARSYAKPFGGRIGPWDGVKWPRTAQNSQPGGGSQPRVDFLLPPRIMAQNVSAGNTQSIAQAGLLNYSRFPGDMMGLTSQLAMAPFQGLRGVQLRYDWFKRSWLPMEAGQLNDPVLFAPDNEITADLRPAYELARQYELAAVAPDLFDITYYSIEPNFGVNYLPRLIAARTQLGIPGNVPLRGDLGSVNSQQRYLSVRDQLKIATERGLVRPETFYWVRDKSHFLTGWTPGDVLYDYSRLPTSRFGRCGLNDDRTQEKFPGSCISNGGRTGYSVKLVSREHLLSGRHQVGGPGEPAGALLNPPRLNEGW